MDPALKALCMGVLWEDVDSEQFAWLLIETGVNVEGPEWEVATRLIGEGEVTNSLAKKCSTTVH